MRNVIEEEHETGRGSKKGLLTTVLRTQTRTQDTQVDTVRYDTPKIKN